MLVDFSLMLLEALVSCHQISVSFSQIESASVILSQFQTVLSMSYKTKTHKFVTDRKVGRNNTQEFKKI